MFIFGWPNELLIGITRNSSLDKFQLLFVSIWKLYIDKHWDGFYFFILAINGNI